MPVITRSKRKSAETYEIPSKTRYVVRLVDITNQNNEKPMKAQITSQKSDSVLYISSQKRESRASQVDSLKSSTSNVWLSQNSHQIDPFIAMRKVKKILENNVGNPASRLQLDVIPNCLYDLEK